MEIIYEVKVTVDTVVVAEHTIVVEDGDPKMLQHLIQEAMRLCQEKCKAQLAEHILN